MSDAHLEQEYVLFRVYNYEFRLIFLNEIMIEIKNRGYTPVGIILGKSELQILDTYSYSGCSMKGCKRIFGLKIHRSRHFTYFGIKAEVQ
jgi:hypothetical protein